jgi:hypothetical protein
MMKTILKSTAMYGCEAWSISEKDKVMGNIQERKILGKVYGTVLVHVF